MKNTKKLCKKKFCKVCDHGVIIDGKAHCIKEVRASCPSFYPKENK